MAILNQKQRNFIGTETADALLAHLNRTFQKISSNMYKLAGQTPTELPFHFQNLYGNEEEFWLRQRIKLNYPKSVFSREVCLSMEEKAKSLAEDITEPLRDWYLQEITAGNYEMVISFEECMSIPRSILTFQNKEKEIRRLRKVFIDDFNAKYEACAEDLSELRAVVLDANKFMKSMAKRVMLCDNKEAVLIGDNLLSEIKNI